MFKIKRLSLAALLVGAVAAAPVSAATYFLNDSNTQPAFPDGTSTYLTVTVTPTVANTWSFVVDVLGSLPSGVIKEFGFNFKAGTTISGLTLPANYAPTTPTSGSLDGYGTFDVAFGVTSNNDALDPLSFSVTTAAGAPANWWEDNSTGGGQPAVYFGAHVVRITGFDDVTSAYFGGGTGGPLPPAEIPIPAAAWLLGAGLMAMGAIGRRRLGGRV